MKGAARNDLTHEWPLVIFTAVAIPAAGVLAARAILQAFHLAPPEGVSHGAMIALLAALVASLFHLGRPLRAPLALRRAGRSALSTEVFLVTAVLALSALGEFSAVAPAIRRACVLGAGICALLLLVAIGLVYFLPGRRPWRTALIASPLTCGLAAAMIAVAATSPTGLHDLASADLSAIDLKLGADVPTSALTTLALLFLLLDAIVAAPAWAGHSTIGPRFVPLHAAIFARRRALIVSRFVMVNVAPATLLLAGMPLPAALIFLAGLFVDRFAFYGTVCAETTEGEIAEIESMIARSD